jgi:hypothetical protein
MCFPYRCHHEFRHNRHQDSILQTMVKNFGHGVLTKTDMKILEARVRGAFDGEGFLSLPKLLTGGAGADKKGAVSSVAEAKKLPIKVEICSGVGEWVAAQARADQGKALWAACEIRHGYSFCLV